MRGEYSGGGFLACVIVVRSLERNIWRKGDTHTEATQHSCKILVTDGTISVFIEHLKTFLQFLNLGARQLCERSRCRPFYGPGRRASLERAVVKALR